jgi:Phosphatidylinositol 3- and 4-kinase
LVLCPARDNTTTHLFTGYSVITYLLQIKDRHNGNILLDREGHLIHIDFGFMLSNSPGNIGFEAAPFKLPLEYIEVLGGVDGEPLHEFRRLFHEGFEAARKHCDRIITMVELMQKGAPLAVICVGPASDHDDRLDAALLCGVWRADGRAAAGAVPAGAHTLARG